MDILDSVNDLTCNIKGFFLVRTGKLYKETQTYQDTAAFSQYQLLEILDFSHTLYNYDKALFHSVGFKSLLQWI